jgi:hypothetical protein
MARVMAGPDFAETATGGTTIAALKEPQSFKKLRRLDEELWSVMGRSFRVGFSPSEL